MASTHNNPTVSLPILPTIGWRSPLIEGTISFALEKAPLPRKENAHGQVYRIGRPCVKLHRRGHRSPRQAAALPGRRDQRIGPDRLHSDNTRQPLPLPRRRHSSWLVVRGSLTPRAGNRHCWSSEETGVQNRQARCVRTGREASYRRDPEQGLQGARLVWATWSKPAVCWWTTRCGSRTGSRICGSHGVLPAVGSGCIRSPGANNDKKLPAQSRPQAEILYRKHDALIEMRKQAQKPMLAVTTSRCSSISAISS